MQTNDTKLAIVAVIVLVVGMAVAGLLYTFTTVLTGQTYQLVEEDLDAITSYTTTSSNDTITINQTWNALGNTSIKESSLLVYIAANWTDITAYVDVNATNGTLKVNDTAHWTNGSACKALYVYDDGTVKDAVKTGIQSNIEAQEQIGQYMPIIALAIIITIVISLIIGGIAEKFMGPKNKGGFGGFV